MRRRGVVPLLLAFILTAAVNLPAQDWPPARGYAQSVFCERTGEILLRGGQSEPGRGLTDVWIYAPSSRTWTPIPSEPRPGFGEGPIVYDPAAGKVIFFQTYNGVEDIPLALTWVFDPAARTWTRLSPAKSPPKGIFGARMVYDRSAARVILFGGEGSNQTWEFDPGAGTWKLVPLRPAPPSRNFHQMVYDAAGNRTLVWGGTQDTRTWTYTYGSEGWKPLEGTDAPAPVVYGAMAYLAGARSVLLFGGAAPRKETVNADTWKLDPGTNKWARLAPAASPPPGAWHAAAVDTRTDLLYLFGGGPDRAHPTNELWVFDPLATSWTREGPPAPAD